MLAALKFFLGQDEAEAADSDDEDEPDAPRLVNPSKAEVYKATKKVGSLEGAGPIRPSAVSIASVASRLAMSSPRIHWLEQRFLWVSQACARPSHKFKSMLTTGCTAGDSVVQEEEGCQAEAGHGGSEETAAENEAEP